MSVLIMGVSGCTWILSICNETFHSFANKSASIPAIIIIGVFVMLFHISFGFIFSIILKLLFHIFFFIFEHYHCSIALDIYLNMSQALRPLLYRWIRNVWNDKILASLLHRAVSLWKDKFENDKETNGYQSPKLSARSLSKTVMLHHYTRICSGKESIRNYSYTRVSISLSLFIPCLTNDFSLFLFKF